MRLLIFLVLLHCAEMAKGQSDLLNNTVWSISVFNHSISLPVYDKLTKLPLNIGVAIGAEFAYNQNQISSIHQRVEVGYYQHKHLNKAFFIKTDFVNRFTSELGVTAEYNVGLGYMLDIQENQTFKLKDGGGFTSENVGMRGGFLFALGLGGGYNIEAKDQRLVSPFVKYEGMLQFPYSDFLPVFPHTLLHLGSRFTTNNN